MWFLSHYVHSKWLPIFKGAFVILNAYEESRPTFLGNGFIMLSEFSINKFTQNDNFTNPYFFLTIEKFKK